MLIATFGPSTGWAGRTITFENELFFLEGYGVISARDVAEYDRQGHLVWPYEGMSAWLHARASSTPPGALCILCGRLGSRHGDAGAPLCDLCRDALELLTDREIGKGVTVESIDTEEKRRQVEARIYSSWYSVLLDGGACPACLAMEGRTTSDLVEAESWTPNPACTSPGGCRCATIFEMTSLSGGEVQSFVQYAAQNRLPATAQAVAHFHSAVEATEQARSEQLRTASLLAQEARSSEKTDPERAALLYREAVGKYLAVDAGADRVGQVVVRRGLLFIFNRLSLVLKRAGLTGEALEVIDQAASLGLLGADSSGVKQDQAALAKRRDALRQTSA